MFKVFDSKKGTLRLVWLLVFDVIAVLFLTGLMMRNLIPARGAGIASLLLFFGNWLVVRRAKPQALELPSNRDRALKLLRLPAVVYTAAFAVAITALVMNPNRFNAGQVIVGSLLAAYIWFLVYRLTRRKKDRLDKQ
jgi:hypothetical protein